MKFISRSIVHLKQNPCHHQCKHIKCPLCSSMICEICYSQSVEKTGKCPQCKKAVSMKLKTQDVLQYRHSTATNTIETPRITKDDYIPSPRAHIFDIPSTTSNITFRKEIGCDYSIINYATISKCIEYITSTECCDIYFSECFILVYPLVVDGLVLMDLLLDRFDPSCPENIPFDVFVTTTLELIRNKVMGLLRMWLKYRSCDFKNELMSNKLSLLMEKIWNHHPQSARFIQAQINKSVSQIQNQNTSSSFQHNRIQSISVFHAYTPRGSMLSENFKEKNITRDTFSFKSRQSMNHKHKHNVLSTSNSLEENPPIVGMFCHSPLVSAQQLCLIQMELFQNIALDEFLKQGWTKKEKEQLAPGILHMARFSNHVIHVVQNRILQFQLTSDRAFALKYFISVAKHLKSLNNFDGLKAVLAGLASTAVFRLRNTWDMLDLEDIVEYEKLDEFVAATNNFSQLREATKLACPPSIPFIGSILTDLIYTSDGNKSAEGDMINFYKVRGIGNILVDLQNKQKATFPYQIIPKLKGTWCDKDLVNNDESLYRMSCVLEQTRKGEVPKDQKKMIEKGKKVYEMVWKTYTKLLNKVNCDDKEA
ncbi:Ras guanine nucleotide exchange factor [Entamoeba marina]